MSKNEMVFRFGGEAEVVLTDRDGTKTVIGTFPNVITDKARQQIFNTLFWNGSTPALSASHCITKVGFYEAAKTPVAGAFHNHEFAAVTGTQVDTSPTIGSTTDNGDSCSVSVSASWNNGTGGDVVIESIGFLYDSAGGTDDTYAAIDIVSTTVENGQTLTINYVSYFAYGTS